jgi:hypothetical protein
MTRLLVLGLLACTLSACTETMYMKAAKTGVVATCGGHSLMFPIYATIASTHDKECVQDYKEQGFLRVATPN